MDSRLTCPRSVAEWGQPDPPNPKGRFAEALLREIVYETGIRSKETLK